MKHEIVMPRLSEDVEEGILVTWFVELGSIVKKDSLLAEVQVEKSSAEISAPADGEVIDLRVQPGEVVAQGAVIAILQETAADSMSEATGAQTAIPTPPPAEPKPQATPPSPSRTEPINQLRRVTAERLTNWKAQTAQVTITTDANVTELIAALGRLDGSDKRGPSLVSAVLKACALALQKHPRLAAQWTEDALVLPPSLDIGVAVALETGLIVPVVRAAETKDVSALADEISALAERARTSQLKANDQSGGVFTISNLGAFGVDAFTPLLNPPQTAILGMGRAKPTPVVLNGSVAVQTIMVLSLTFDHRVVDGVPAAEFLRDVVAHLQEPTRVIGPA